MVSKNMFSKTRPFSRSKINKLLFVQPGFDFAKLESNDFEYLLELKNVRKSFLLSGHDATKKQRLTPREWWSQFFFKPSKLGATKLTEENSVEVLHGIDLKIKRGEMVAIMGTSGSGKSTLMNIIGTLDRPTSGQYLFAGFDITQFSREDLSKLRGRKIGFVFQSFNLLSNLSVAKNILRPMMYAQVPANSRASRVAEVLEVVSLLDKKDSDPLRLSGGQQQRVAIARALVMKPELILADEPTGALDSKTAQLVMLELQRINRTLGTTIVLVTHDAQTARYAQRIIRVKDGLIARVEKGGQSCSGN
jgi:putative ABC transport system ATP-binding protein